MDAGISKKSYSQILKVKYNPDKVFSYYIILYIISHFFIRVYYRYIYIYIYIMENFIKSAWSCKHSRGGQ